MKFKRALKTAGEEPVSVVDLKAQLRVDSAIEDDLIESYGKTARACAEQYTGRALSTQTWYLYLDSFPFTYRQLTYRPPAAGVVIPVNEIILPLPPLQSVVAITYVDSNGDTQTLAADQYVVDTAEEPGRIYPAYNVTWPATRYQKNAVRVEFGCGYRSDDDSPPVGPELPEPIALFIKAATGWMNENRELQEMPYYGLLDLYRISF